MTAFNTVQGSADCPNCGRRGQFEVQFKYGNTWQQVYKLGEQLTWGGNDIGQPGRKLVLAEGIGGPCGYCGHDNLGFELEIEDDRLTVLRPARKSCPPLGATGFLVVKP